MQNMEMFLSQQPASDNIPYKTPKHSSHDNLWLLPGVSTPLFCFGCAIENLENKDVLKYRKKHILTDLLEIFLTNRTIWQLFGNKNSVHVHVVKLLLTIMMENNEQELCELTSELCLLIMKRTSEEKIAVLIMEEVLTKIQHLENPTFLKFLNNLLTCVPAVVINLCDNKASFICKLISFISSCKQEFQLPTWSLLSSILSAICTEEISIAQNVLRQIMLLTVETSTVSTSVDLQILSCLQSFLRIKNSQKILLQHECSHLTTISNSVLEYFKKMLLCSSEEGKVLAISCISTIAETNLSNEDDNSEFSSLLNFMIEKGMTEYLLELLLSSNSLVIQQLFQCLEKLTSCKKFHSLGHMVYGFSSIIKAVMSTDDDQCILQGLLLINVILKERIEGNHDGTFTKLQEIELINLTKKCFESADDSIKNGSAICLCSLLSYVDSFSSASQQSILDLLEVVFIYMERELSNTQIKSAILNLVNNSYKAAMLFVNLIATEMKPDNIDKSASFSQDTQKDTEKIIDMLFYYCDKYFIPQAVLKFLPQKNVEFQSIFYQQILAIIQLDTVKGEMLSKKMCESSFISMVYEFKLVASRLPNQQKIVNSLGQLLSYLCASIESIDDVRKLYDDDLVESIINFNIPLHDWNSLLENVNESNSCINTNRTVLLCLLACSHMIECSLVPLPLLHPFLDRFSFTRQVSSLSMLGRRYFVYLCCQITMSTNTTVSIANNKFFSQYLTENNDKLNILFHGSESFLVWLVKINCPTSIFQTFLVNYFMQDTKNLENLTSILQQNNCFFLFIESSLKSLCSISNNPVQQCLCVYLTNLVHLVEENRHGYLKHLIHKHLLIIEEFNHSAITMYVKLLNIICVQSGSNITDEDLKLFCRLLDQLDLNTVPMLMVEVLQFIYVILTKGIHSQDIKPITILMKKTELPSTFSKLFFNHETLLQNSNFTLLMESLYYGIVLVTSLLMHCSRIFAISPQHKITCRKEFLIELLASENFPLLQLALLKLWCSIFNGWKFQQSSIIQFIDTEDENSQLDENDLHLVLVALHNLHFNQQLLVRREAAVCYLSMFVNVDAAKPLLASPWNDILKDNLLSIVSSSNIIDSSIVTLLHALLFASSRYTEDIGVSATDMISKITKQINPNENQHPRDEDGVFLVRLLMCFIKTFISCFLSQLQYETLKSIKADLKILEKKRGKNDTQSELFINIFGLIFAPNLFELSHDESIKELRKIIDERITEIDDDETESGEDMD